MIKLYRQSLAGQYGAALAALASAIEKCPQALWDVPIDGGPAYWRLAYHTLFYLDLYVSENEAAFRPASFHEEHGQLFESNQSWLPADARIPETVYTKEQLLLYLADCRKRCRRAIASLDEETLAGPSGFEWIPFSRAELMLYNLRHVQHHTGQLGLLLRRRGGIENAWIGSREL